LCEWKCKHLKKSLPRPQKKTFFGNKKKNRMAPWNVRSLYRSGGLRITIIELQKYKIAIAAIQETKWTKSNSQTFASNECNIYPEKHGAVAANWGTVHCTQSKRQLLHVKIQLFEAIKIISPNQYGDEVHCKRTNIEIKSPTPFRRHTLSEKLTPVKRSSVVCESSWVKELQCQ
jgi:hypothetical protein